MKFESAIFLDTTIFNRLKYSCEQMAFPYCEQHQKQYDSTDGKDLLSRKIKIQINFSFDY